MNGHHLQIRYGGISRMLMANVEIGSAFSPKNGDPIPPRKPFQGLWDTGATGTVITQGVVDALGLKPTSMTKVRHAQGESIAEVYLISFKFPDSIGFPTLHVTKGILGDFDVLIGMDVISRGDLTITNHGGETELNFQYPPQGLKEMHDARERMNRPPQPPARPPAPAKPYAGTPRNAPCPCGSGEKYKKCHGA